MKRTTRKDTIGKWGEKCFVCSMDMGIESDHVKGRRVDEEQRPLCGTCHNLKTAKDIVWDERTQRYAPNLGKAFYLSAPLCPQPSHAIQTQLIGFWKTVGELWETTDSGRLTLYHDAVDDAFFTECHASARQIAALIDLEPALHGVLEKTAADGLVKLTRDVVEESPVFKDMQSDAAKGRPFSDIVVEWNTSYRLNRPLKVIGGQHRTWSIRMAIDSDADGERLHGLKVYFGLDGDKRASLSIVFNRNIAIAKPYLDRLVEHRVVGGDSMYWARQVGLLKDDEDFTDRVTGTKRFTAQIVWCLITNFFRGRQFNGKLDDSLHEAVHIARAGTGGLDKNYMEVIDRHHPGLWSQADVLEMGRRFAELHTRQIEGCSKPREKFRDLRKVQHRYKALTPSLAAAWAYTAGVLQAKQRRLKAHYELAGTYDSDISPDPLNALQMSAQKHWSEKAYRGLGTRQNAKEAQRLTKLFLLLTLPDYQGGISKELIESTMDEHALKMMAVEAERKKEKAKRVAKRFKGLTGAR